MLTITHKAMLGGVPWKIIFFIDEDKGEHIGSPVREYTLKKLSDILIQTPEQKKKSLRITLIIFLVSFIFTLIVMNITFDEGFLYTLFPSFLVSPGVGLVITGILCLFPSAQVPVEFGSAKIKVNAKISNFYTTTEKTVYSYGEDSVQYSKWYYTDYDCYNDGIFYTLTRKGDRSTVPIKKPKIGDAAEILLDVEHPEESVIMDELISHQKGYISGGIFLIVFGLIWVGMFVISVLTGPIKNDIEF